LKHGRIIPEIYPDRHEKGLPCQKTNNNTINTYVKVSHTHTHEGEEPVTISAHVAVAVADVAAAFFCVFLVAMPTKAEQEVAGMRVWRAELGGTLAARRAKQEAAEAEVKKLEEEVVKQGVELTVAGGVGEGEEEEGGREGPLLGGGEGDGGGVEGGAGAVGGLGEEGEMGVARRREVGMEEGRRQRQRQQQQQGLSLRRGIF
jgi:hypothetical protein